VTAWHPDGHFRQVGGAAAISGGLASHTLRMMVCAALPFRDVAVSRWRRHMGGPVRMVASATVVRSGDCVEIRAYASGLRLVGSDATCVL